MEEQAAVNASVYDFRAELSPEVVKEAATIVSKGYIYK